MDTFSKSGKQMLPREREEWQHSVSGVSKAGIGVFLREQLFLERELEELWRAGASFDLKFSTLQTQFDIFRALKRVSGDFGFRSFMVMHLPSELSEASLSSLLIISSWPAEMLSQYDALGLPPGSPLTQRSSAIPFRFDLDQVAEEDRGGAFARALELFERFGVRRGAYFPVSDASGNRGLVVFSGDRPHVDSSEILRLQVISSLIFNKLAQMRHGDEQPPEQLSQREIDCLVWTSAGKTSSEIADILDLSEHTVNHHLNRVAKKLGTVNRTQAVAKALRIGLIR